MTEQAVEESTEQKQEVLIDPFSFFPGIASKIAGLGGNAPGHDPHYVFHTDYFEAAPGPSRFIVQFHGLRARRGTLWLRVHMLPLETGARAVMVNSERIQLNRLIQNKGRVEIAFEGFRAMSFGLYAAIQDDTDAEADGIEVWFDRPFDPNDAAVIAADARSTSFGRDAARPVALMLSVEPARFARPSVQVATADQLHEASYRTIAGELGLHAQDPDDWQQAYVLQALRRYGYAQSGARGLGFNVGASRLPTLLATAGMAICATDPDWNDADDAPEQAPIERRRLAVGPPANDLIDFDFAWSTNAWDALGASAQALPFIESTLTALRPGGFAVHTGGYWPEQSNKPNSAWLSRVEVERILLILISRGHEVGQFHVAAADALRRGADGAGAIGLIVRKAGSAL